MIMARKEAPKLADAASCTIPQRTGGVGDIPVAPALVSAAAQCHAIRRRPNRYRSGARSKRKGTYRRSLGAGGCCGDSNSCNRLGRRWRFVGGH